MTAPPRRPRGCPAAGCNFRNVSEAKRELAIPREVSERSVSVALALDSDLDEDTQQEFLRRVLTPETDEK